jgi:histidinol phosphatase-like PHP family hydrolase
MQIHNIDLHYHAGQERQAGVTLTEYIDYAQKTARKILGITDHYHLYFLHSPIDREFPYEKNLRGFLKFREDVESQKPLFPEMTILFAPEIAWYEDFAEIPAEVIRVSDYFICEPPFKGDFAENTAQLLKRMNEISQFAKAAGKPVFLAHPFRIAVNYRLIEREIGPEVTAIQTRESFEDFSCRELDEFFMFDIKKIAQAAQKLQIPMEINGNTQFRIRSTNLPGVLQMLWAALKVMKEEGVEFVPGSDLHGFVTGLGKMGEGVPEDCFRALGVDVSDLKFLERVLG